MVSIKEESLSWTNAFMATGYREGSEVRARATARGQRSEPGLQRGVGGQSPCGLRGDLEFGPNKLEMDFSRFTWRFCVGSMGITGSGDHGSDHWFWGSLVQGITVQITGSGDHSSDHCRHHVTNIVSMTTVRQLCFPLLVNTEHHTLIASWHKTRHKNKMYLGKTWCEMNHFNEAQDIQRAQRQ